jgi:hypothetical protein
MTWLLPFFANFFRGKKRSLINPYTLSLFVSLEELLREEVQKQIDKAIEDIPWTTTRLSTSRAKLAVQYKDISDFIYGYEYGCIISNCISYYQSKATVGLATGEELRQATKIIISIMSDRLPEIRQAISRIV